MPVAERPQEAGLGAVLRNLHDPLMAALGQPRVARLPKELVHQRDLEEDPVVHGPDELVRRPPL